MKIAIVGAGSIGGFLGARLAAAGQAQVCALARGATLHSLQSQGWRLLSPDGPLQAPARASHDAAELGPQGAVNVAVIAPACVALAAPFASPSCPHPLRVAALLRCCSGF